ncbi:Ig-like domain-containing protein [Frankia gtarii]|uniref:Ig-like domain-containing protein n=1 Tax=Frankia gtarii TaxID=2950102 RepID=UPI0021BE75F6|nr:Ig-like domain-containing protein [Frankia gtarii]
MARTPRPGGHQPAVRPTRRPDSLGRTGRGRRGQPKRYRDLLRRNDPLATVPLTAGKATLSTTRLQPGTHPIAVSYSGGPTFKASTTTAPTTITIGFSQPTGADRTDHLVSVRSARTTFRGRTAQVHTAQVRTDPACIGSTGCNDFPG